MRKKYLKNGFGSIVNFGIKGGREAGRKVIDNVTDLVTCCKRWRCKITYYSPGFNNTSTIGAEDLKKSGVTEELIRLSVGLESTEDIIADLAQAIEKAVPVTA